MRLLTIPFAMLFVAGSFCSGGSPSKPLPVVAASDTKTWTSFAVGAKGRFHDDGTARFKVEKVLSATEIRVFGGYCGKDGPIDGPYWTVSNIDASKISRNDVIFLPDLYEITAIEQKQGSSPNRLLKRIAIVDLKK